ncbi:ABC transporter substrate-binding protein [Streptomyces celluloflavus]|uniref:ABC transporter substrate-binding protein n=1 Tax=Streptomyces celluloflavus TaxID=58344 RepID=UPI0036DF983A
MTDHVRPGRAARRGRRAAALMAAGVLLPLPALAGCDRDDAAEAVAASQDIAPAARARLKDGGTVRWAVDAMPGTFNAFQADANGATARITGAVLPTLFTVDGRGVPHRNADYLDAADISAREPKQVVTYKINPRARWSDGRAVGAADFLAQWEALRGKDNAYWTARNAGYDRIDKVEQGAGPHEVKVTFGRPYADWQSLFTPLYPKSVMGDPNAFNDGAREQLPVVAGPFAVQERDADDGTVTLVRNRKWWGAPARLDRLVLTVVPADKRAAALAAGALDVAEIDHAAARRVATAQGPASSRAPKDSAGGNAGPPAAGRDEELADGAGSAVAPRAPGSAQARADVRTAADSVSLRGYTVRKGLEPAYTQLALNGGTGPLADARVRRAVARAINRQQLADTVLKPLDLPARPLGSHLLMSGQQGYQDHSEVLGGQDTRAARALLADAGWRAPGDGPQQAGQPAELPAPGAASPAERHGPAAPKAGAPARHAPPGGRVERARPVAAVAPLSAMGALGSELQQDALLRQAASFYKEAAADRLAAAGGDTGAPEYADAQRYRRRAAQALGAAELLETGQAADDGKAAYDGKGRGAPEGGRPGAPAARPAADPPDAGGDAGEDADGDVSDDAGPPAGKKGAGARAGAVPTVKKDGKPLTLRFVLPDGPGAEQLRAVGDRIAEMLDRVGVQTSVQEVGDAGYFRDHIASGDYDLALYTWPGSAYPATDARPIYAKPQPAADGSLTVEQNYTRVGTDRIDQLFEQAASELDGEAAHRLMARADSRIWAVAASIPLYQRPELVATRRSLANVGAFGFATPRFQDIGYRK